MSDNDDVMSRFMERFRCIGPACEQHCCGGWRIDVDETHAAMLRASAGAHGSDRQRIRSAILERPDPRRAGKKGKKPKNSLEFKADKDGNCVLLEPDRRCHIHATLGADMLPNVCATYPRRVLEIGERRELSATLSCPEVARQVLLHEDALDHVPLDRSLIPRRILASKLDLRDLRPSVRLIPDVRAFARRRLSDAARPFSHRLFALTLFAHRTRSLLATARPWGDFAPILEEIARFDQPEVLDEIGRRFDAIELPALPVLLVAREIVRQDSIGGRHPSFRVLVNDVFDTYAALDITELRETMSADEAMSTAIQREYAARRARTLALAGPLIERRLKNFILHAWGDHLPRAAPDLMVFVQRLWLHLATVRFLFFSHPRMNAWLVAHPDGAEITPEARAAFEAICDLTIVEVVRTTARYVDHSGLISTLEEMLRARGLDNLGGTVHLIKF